MVMEKAHKWYKGQNQNKPFTLEYLWRDLKNLPKWHRVLKEDESKKRTKISELIPHHQTKTQKMKL
jgi:hypothetical protein